MVPRSVRSLSPFSSRRIPTDVLSRSPPKVLLSCLDLWAAFLPFLLAIIQRLPRHFPLTPPF